MIILRLLALMVAITSFAFILGVESKREKQCTRLTARAKAPARYTLLEGCQLQHADGIWRSAISIDVR